MKKRKGERRFWGWMIVLFFGMNAGWLGTASAHQTLSVEDYLKQVKTQNPGIQSAILSTEAGEQRSQEGRLLLAPTLFANAQLTSDGKLGPIRFLNYNSQITQIYSVGISQLTSFGLEAKFRYDLYLQYFNNPTILFQIPGVSTDGAISTSYALASPVLELTQSLWSNGFGRSTQAQQEQAEAQALASHYSQRFVTRSKLVEAEMRYWTLALSRQALGVQKEALIRAQKIYDWASRRAKLHLGDKADVLQAEALQKSRELELMTAQDEVRTTSRAFNSNRSIDSEIVTETLQELGPTSLDTLAAPPRAAVSDEIRAAQESTRAGTAAATLAAERDLPTLELFGSLALNGQTSSQVFGSLGDSVANSLSLARPTQTLGIRLRAPLSPGLISESREGWRKEKLAAEKALDRKLFEQEQTWKNLTETFTETQQRLELAKKLEQIQKLKLEHEKIRQQQGRSTTYQVLLFETDFLNSQLLRIRNQAQLLAVFTQMKLFGEAL